MISWHSKVRLGEVTVIECAESPYAARVFIRDITMPRAKKK
jgi:hypothetical protein